VFVFPVYLVLLAHCYVAKYHSASIHSGDRPAPTLMQAAEQLAWWSLTNLWSSLLGNVLAMTHTGKDWHGAAVQQQQQQQQRQRRGQGSRAGQPTREEQVHAMLAARRHLSQQPPGRTR
jgi:uncharacterized protein YfaS (alpha-2-macroglobulin family)